VRRGDIVLAVSPAPSHEEIIKRIESRANSRLWLVGDNRADSVDSYTFGAVDVRTVRGLCLVRLPRSFDGPTGRSDSAMAGPPRDPEKLAKSGFRVSYESSHELLELRKRGLIEAGPKEIRDCKDTEVSLSDSCTKDLVVESPVTFSRIEWTMMTLPGYPPTSKAVVEVAGNSYIFSACKTHGALNVRGNKVRVSSLDGHCVRLVELWLFR